MKTLALIVTALIALTVPALAADGGSVALGFGLFIVLVAVYLIPTFVANNRGHLSTGAIFAFNLFLGWTFLGWVLALVWALNSNTRANAEKYSRRLEG